MAPPEKKVELADLVAILRLMEVPPSLLQDFLEVICERFNLPDEPEEPGGEGQELFQVSCSSHDSHLVSPVGFLLLESNAFLICSTLKSVLFSFSLEFGLGQKGRIGPQHFQNKKKEWIFSEAIFNRPTC